MDRIPSHSKNYTTRRWVPSSAGRDLVITGIAIGICLAACCAVHALDAGPGIAPVLSKHPRRDVYSLEKSKEVIFMSETFQQVAERLTNIRAELDGAIAILTMNRPKALNALNDQTLEELDRIFTCLEREESILGVIITGEGKGFVARAAPQRTRQ